MWTLMTKVSDHLGIYLYNSVLGNTIICFRREKNKNGENRKLPREKGESKFNTRPNVYKMNQPTLLDVSCLCFVFHFYIIGRKEKKN